MAARALGVREVAEHAGTGISVAQGLYDVVQGGREALWGATRTGTPSTPACSPSDTPEAEGATRAVGGVVQAVTARNPVLGLIGGLGMAGGHAAVHAAEQSSLATATTTTPAATRSTRAARRPTTASR